VVANQDPVFTMAAFQSQNQLDLALQELDRIERTLFMVDWLEPSVTLS
jgi:TnpA family transposase